MSTGAFQILDYRFPLERLNHVQPKTKNDGTIDFGTATAATAITGNLQMNPELDSTPQLSGALPRGDAILFTETELIPGTTDNPDTGDVVRAYLDAAKTRWEDYNVEGVVDRHTITDAMLGVARRQGYVLRRRHR